MKILNFPISKLDLNKTAKLIIKWAENKKRKYVLTCTVNEIVQSRKLKLLKQSLLNADLLVPDGMSLVWAARILKNKKIARVYGPDLMLTVCHLSKNKNIRHYFYGSTKQVLKKLIRNLRLKFPNLNVAGFASPPFRKLTRTEKTISFQQIKKVQPSIIWVGLGGPKQSIWANNALQFLHPCVVVGVGAAFDFISGTKKQAPLWMQQNGLEWFFRLLQEPKRLWKRYIIAIPTFGYLVLKELFTDKK